MRTVFADTWHWIAIISRRDQAHQAAIEAHASLGAGVRILTTEEVLAEVLTALSGLAERVAAAQSVRRLLTHPDVTVVAQSHDSFREGLELYEARRDKTYSLTDCISMQAMQRRSIAEVLTRDEHFEQEGFICIH
jgi:predicted nucleic acid-binding protein